MADNDERPIGPGDEVVAGPGTKVTYGAGRKVTLWYKGEISKFVTMEEHRQEL